MCLVNFYDADLFDATLAEAVVRTGDIPGSVGVNHVWLLLTLPKSESASTVPRRQSSSPVVGILMEHCWRYF